MTLHAPTQGNQSPPPLPNQPFFSWVRTQTGLFISQVFGLSSTITIPLALFYYSKHAITEPPLPGQPAHGLQWEELEKLGQYVVYAHLLVLVLFIVVLIRKLDKNDIGKYRSRLVHEKLSGGEGEKDEKLSVEREKKLQRLAVYSEKQVGRFKLRFLFFWCSMFALYLIFAVEPQFRFHLGEGLSSFTCEQMFWAERFPLLSFALNNLSLLFVFWCFTVLYIPSDSTTGDFPPQDPTPPARADASSTDASSADASSADASSTDAEAWKEKWQRFRRFMGRFPRYLRGTDLEGPERRQRILIVRFVVVVALLTLSFPLIMFSKIETPTNWSEFPAVFFALSGTINAVVLALLVARLDSKLIGLPSWLICMLYFYAGVQPMFVVFELHPEVYAGIKAVVLWVVFIFKIYFFLIIFYALQTGRVFNFFFCSQLLNEHVETLREEQRGARLSLSPSATSSDVKQSAQVDAEGPGWRATWLKGLGVVAILFFATSLLLYVYFSEDQKRWVDSFPLSKGVILFHIGLLIFILGLIFSLVFRDWRRAKKRQVTSSKDLRFEAPSKLMLKLWGLPEAEGELKKNDLAISTENQFKSFTRYFRLFWIFLLVLYVTMLFSLPVHSKPPQLIPVAVSPTNQGNADKQWVLPGKTDLFRGHNIVPFWWHSWGSPNWSIPDIAEKGLSIAELPRDVNFSFAFFIINNLMVLVLFWCFAVLYIPNDDKKFDEKHRLLFRYSLVIFVLITFVIPLLAIIVAGNGLTESEISKIPTILGAVGGTLNAVAFAVLIARLDSRIIGLKLFLVAVLYAYAALQPLFVTFNQPSDLLKFIATSAMIAAFLFKICLVFMVGHVRNSGGLINYLWFFPFLSKSVNTVFDNQFEIKAYSPKYGWFTFLISDKNVEKFRALEIYRSREECDRVIETLVKAMKARKSDPEVQSMRGTHWVRLKSGKRVVCESISLRSEAEAKELIRESVEKIPYCKYDRGW